VVEREARVGARMALATTFARLTGYGRSVLLVAALGNGLHADVFSIANTVPNMLVVLLGAGIFNAVLVPQLVRAHLSGVGPGFVNQVITLFGAILLTATVVITLAAPLVLQMFVSPALTRPDLADQYRSAIALAFFCLPQIFFYGVFALLGQILNSRGVFGPMMWAPILNNMVAIGVLVAYLDVYGSGAARCSGYTRGQELLLDSERPQGSSYSASPSSRTSPGPGTTTGRRPDSCRRGSGPRSGWAPGPSRSWRRTKSSTP
jgi:putative peptidoglycan lipid II flippase